MFAKLYKAICKALQSFEDTGSYVHRYYSPTQKSHSMFLRQIFAKLCKALQTFVKQSFAKLCKYLQSFAANLYVGHSRNL